MSETSFLGELKKRTDVYIDDNVFPDGLLLGDRIKAATIIIATGASVLVGTIVGELISNTPVGTVPVIGEILQAFGSTLVSGLLSCTLLIFLDRSKLMNAIINGLNMFPSETNNYKGIADVMERLAAKLSNIDISLFREETENSVMLLQR
ncbi:hypothetical protein EHE19_015470 [Ruminiclostridium herbifermentans]|uniref:Uncharacterized protein n=1 Tax=Ruminiclostridium herbifermentans TaxID=2488810 RepID=A0A4U7JHU6_9FIRM|nr:hypothetical protein [Ruminiclostridium herbifermentans]QNU66265.1 hypothetical protein EHE19_015470 [Ruminiclostridium herbifermentans]